MSGKGQVRIDIEPAVKLSRKHGFKREELPFKNAGYTEESSKS
jgi:hypothetical protein